MTGWQTAEGHGPSFSNHQETMELWKMISHLSKANQQLVSAHTATLANLEALYVELARERKVRRRAATSDTVDEALKKRLTMEQERVDENEEERRRMEDRVERLENLLADSWDGYQCRQRDASRQEKDRKLRSRVERLEAMMKSRELDKEDERQSFTNIYDSTRNQDSHCRRIINDLCNKLPSGIEVVPEHEFKMQITSDEARTKSISRVNAGHVEEQLERSRSKDETDCLMKRLHLEEPKEQERRLSDEEERSFDRKEVIRLLEEVESLKAERLEYRNENERLAKDLAEQRAIARKLTKDYEVNLIGF